MIQYVYVTTGSKWHTREAILSAKSVKQNTSNSNITIYTDNLPDVPKYFDNIKQIPKAKNLKEAKQLRIQVLLKHPAEQFIHLDSDTYVNTTPNIETTKSIAATTSQWRQTTFSLVPSVIGIIKNAKSIEVLTRWLKQYSTTETTKDQYAFNQCVKEIDDYQILSPEYSTQVGEITHVSGKIIIAHCHYTNQIRNPILPTLVLNQSEQNRLWIPPELRMIEMIYEPENNHKITYPSTPVTQEQLNIVKEFMEY